MASNNVDSTQAQRILADFQGISARGCSFKVLEFAPDVKQSQASTRCF